MFTGPFPINECSIGVCACVAEMCLPSRCLAMGIDVTVRYISHISDVLYNSTVAELNLAIQDDVLMY
jgi:hypothetical protein